jgi:hypothetical protein
VDGEDDVARSAVVRRARLVWSVRRPSETDADGAGHSQHAEREENGAARREPPATCA